MAAHGVMVRIRFNTKHAEDSTQLPWRVLIGEDVNEAEEVLASDYTFNTKPTFPTRDLIAGTGLKFHTACRGTPRWNGTQLVVDDA